MKTQFKMPRPDPAMAALLWALTAAMAHAQSYSLDWHKIAGGGGMSTNAQYSVNGTVGQPDAGVPMSAGGYSVTGGFWSFISVIQSAGVPDLIIVPSGANSVSILWPDPAGNTYTLQQNSDLTTPTWVTSAFSVSSSNGTNRITISPPAGNLFFRLKH